MLKLVCSLLLACLLTVEKLETFLKQFPDYPNSFLIGGPADIFVTELADQVKKHNTILLSISFKPIYILNVFCLACLASLIPASEIKGRASAIVLPLSDKSSQWYAH